MNNFIIHNVLNYKSFANTFPDPVATGHGVAYSGYLHPVYEDVGGTGGEDGAVACDAAMGSPTVSLAVNGNAVDEDIGAGPGGWA